jgi:hypothetical protein
MTLGVRVATTFALLFLVTSAGLLAVNYALFAHSLQSRWVRVPVYSGSHIARYDRALISNPLTPPVELPAARGQLAFVQAHPAEPFGGGLLPLVTGSQSAPPEIDQALNQMLHQSAMILVPLTLLTVALGWLTAPGMLRPVRQLTGTARRMSVANLSQRLRLAGPDDELKELADTCSRWPRASAASTGPTGSTSPSSCPPRSITWLAPRGRRASGGIADVRRR